MVVHPNIILIEDLVDSRLLVHVGYGGVCFEHGLTFSQEKHLVEGNETVNLTSETMRWQTVV